MLNEQDERQLRYSAAGLNFCSFPSDAGRAVRARDMLLVQPIEVEGDADVSDELRDHPPAGVSRFEINGRVTTPLFDLGSGVMLGELASDESELILAACEQRGHYFRAVGQLGVRYVFSLDVSEEAIRNGLVEYGPWDAEQRIRMAIAFSRYIRDNSASTDIVARVVDFENGAQQVIPHRLYESSHTYRLPLVERDWLDDADADALRELLAVYWERHDEMPERVRRAVWRAELAVWTRWADHVLPLIVGAFESLVATRIDELTRNFKRRLPMLAQIIEFSGIDEGLAARLYEARSEGVHGHEVQLVAGWDEDAISDLRLALTLLRRVLRRLIENPEFSDHFRSKDSIDRLFGFAPPSVFKGLTDR